VDSIYCLGVLFKTLQSVLGVLVCMTVVFGMPSAHLMAQSHVAEPALNLGDTSFLDGLGGPGWVVEQIGDGAHDGRIVGSDGETVRGTGPVDSVSGLTHIAWLSHDKLFGGWYGLEVVAATAHVDAGVPGQAGGLGDLTLSPFIIQWPKFCIFGVPLYQRIVFDIDLPVGTYTRNKSVNLSSNAYELNPYYSVTSFPMKRIETSWRVHYLWSSTNTTPPLSTEARSTQAGQAIHFNATTAYNVHGGLWVGANAYYLKQITDGRTDGLAVRNSPEQVGAIGPGMVWNLGKWYFYANGYHELGAENRSTGNKLVLRVEKVF
jgi:hypothetical protein